MPEVVETNAAFLLTDIVGSTRLHHLYPQAMLDAIARHNEVVEKVVVYHGGELFRRRGEGDSTFSVFPSPVEAVRAAIELQRALMNFVVVDDEKLRTRVGIHSGEAVLFDGDYQGTTVNLCARIRSAANGGQIVTTEPVRAGSKGIVFRELGIYRLADVSDELKLYQPIAEGIDRDFPPLRVPFSGNVPTPISPFIGRIDELDAVRQLVQENRLVTLQGLGASEKRGLRSRSRRSWPTDTRVARGLLRSNTARHLIPWSGSFCRSSVDHRSSGRSCNCTIFGMNALTSLSSTTAKWRRTQRGHSPRSC